MPRTQQTCIADAMLGRLAKWLRMLGFDVEYAAGVDDEELVARVEESGRVLVTRDTRLPAHLLARHPPYPSAGGAEKSRNPMMAETACESLATHR